MGLCGWLTQVEIYTYHCNTVNKTLKCSIKCVNAIPNFNLTILRSTIKAMVSYSDQTFLEMLLLVLFWWLIYDNYGFYFLFFLRKRWNRIYLCFLNAYEHQIDAKCELKFFVHTLSIMFTWNWNVIKNLMSSIKNRNICSKIFMWNNVLLKHDAYVWLFPPSSA